MKSEAYESSPQVAVVSEKPDKSSQDEGPKNEKPLPFSKIINLSRKEWPALTVACLCMFISEGLGLIHPLILAVAYDAVVDPQNDTEAKQEEVAKCMTLVLATHAIGIFLGFWRGSIFGIAGERVVTRLRSKLYQRILQQEVGFFDSRKTGELVSRLGSDATTVQVAATSSIAEAMLGFVKVVVSLAFMFFASWRLTMIALSVAILLSVSCAMFGGWIAKISTKYQDALGKASEVSTEAITNLRTVRAFGSEVIELDRYNQQIGNPDDPKNRCCKWWPTPGFNTYRYGSMKAVGGTAFGCYGIGVGIVALYMCVWFGLNQVIEGSLSFGMLMAFQSYVFQIAMGIGQLGGHVVKILEARGAAKRMFEIMEREPIVPPNHRLVPSDFHAEVRLEGVCFSYPVRQDVVVLKNITLHVPENSTAALVGQSGSGKSSVIALLCGFYHATEGKVMISGSDLCSLDTTWVKSKMALVQQEPVLFGLSIRENVCYGRRSWDSSNVEEKEVIEVCQQANAHEFIQDFPDGYDTLVGERGIRLSGGQKQRVAIARALLSGPRILLLDEATSALDAESERLVQDAIDRIVGGRTVIIVAHRLSTVRDAHQIVVVQNGELVDVGTHEALLDRCAKYQELVNRQLESGPRNSVTAGDAKENFEVSSKEHESRNATLPM